MKRIFTLLSVCLMVSACANLKLPGIFRPGGAPQSPEPETSDPPEASAVAPVPPAARTVDDFDTTTTAQKNEALSKAAEGGGVDLGVTIASLGAPSEPGFWLKTPLVAAPARGRVLYPATGKSVEVDLIPIDGPKTAGSRMSLSAMRLVGAPFTGLPEIRVYRTGS